MERKIGEIFEYNGEWYQCVEHKGCDSCAFDISYGIRCSFNGAPYCFYRSDGKSVIFKKLEKVVGTYEKRISDDTFSTFQEYKVYNSAILPQKPYMYCSFIDNTIEIEIKQNKEDMEAKNNNHYDGRMDEECIPLCDALNSLPGVETTSSCCGHCKNDFMIFFNCNDSYSLAVITRAFNRRYSGTFLEWKIEVETHDNGRYDYFMHSVKPYPNESEMKTDVGQLIENLETWKAEEYKEYFNYEGEEKRLVNGMSQEAKKENEQKPTIKPFNLEAARSGKPVCTRDGRKARIICFDRKANTPIVALIECDNHGEILQCVHNDGKCVQFDTSDNDLMMLSEKKERWINVYSLNTCYSSKEEAEANIDRDYEHEYVRTVKIGWEE